MMENDCVAQVPRDAGLSFQVQIEKVVFAFKDQKKFWYVYSVN